MTPNALLHLSSTFVALDAVVTPDAGAAGWRVEQKHFYTTMEELADAMKAVAGAIDDDTRLCAILPSEQIKHVQADAVSLPRSEVLALMEGQTPYDTDDLIVDWRQKDGHTCIAAVAKETLEEARAFCESHGIDPISFATIPEGDWGDHFAFFGSNLAEDTTAPPHVPYVLLPTSAPQTPSVSTEEGSTPKVVTPELAVIAQTTTPPQKDGNTAKAYRPLLWAALALCAAVGGVITLNLNSDAPGLEDPQSTTAADPEAVETTQPISAAPEISQNQPPLPAETQTSPDIFAENETAHATPAPEPAEAEPVVISEPAPAPLDTNPGQADDQDTVETEAPTARPIQPMTVEERYAAFGIWSAAPKDITAPVLEDTTHPQAEVRINTANRVHTLSRPPNSGQRLPALPSIATTPTGQAPYRPQLSFDLEDSEAVEDTAEATSTQTDVPTAQTQSPAEAPPGDDNFAAPVDETAAVQNDTEGQLEELPQATETPEQPVEAPQDQDVAEADTDLFGPDAAPGLRPLARPDTMAEELERAQYGGYTYAELASLRPILRPGGLDIIAQRQAAMITPDMADALASTDNPSTATTFSLRPQNRPQSVETAAAQGLYKSGPEISTAAAAAPPSPPSSSASVTPNRSTGSTRVSVAQAATQENQVNLRKITLLGTFGTSSAKKALVRLPGGRVVRVGIGDRLDGGNVAAIGASQLRYTRGGRTITLKLP